MNLNLFCPLCVKEQSEALDDKNVVASDVPTPMSRPSDDGKYQTVCSKGHECVITVTNLKYDILFELGLNSLIDDGGRDAVMNFTSSLEKFYEFFCKCQLHSVGCSEQCINDSWKVVSKQSERQLGSYVVAFTNLTSNSPPILNPNKEVSFRNKVIHDGYIPRIDEARDYAEAVAKIIYSASDELLKRIPKSVTHIYNLLSPYRDDKDGEINWAEGACNIISAMDIINPCMDSEGHIRDIEGHLRRIKKNRGPTQVFMTKSEDSLNALKDSLDS